MKQFYKKKSFFVKSYSLAVAFLFITNVLLAQSSTFSGTGDWSDVTKWDNGIPTSSTTVTIASGSAVSITSDAECASLSFESGSDNTSVAISAGINLSVTGGITFLTPTSGRTQTIDVGDGILTCADISFNSTNNLEDNILAIGAGTLNVTNIATNTSGASAVTCTGTSTINITGNWTGATRFTEGNSTVNYNGTGAQSVLADGYYNIGFSGGSTKTASGAISIQSVLAVASGSTFDLGNYLLTGSTLTTTGTGTIITTVPTSTSSTPIPSGRTWNPVVNYNSASPQTVVSGTYHSLSCANSAKAAAGAITIAASDMLTIASGASLDMGTNILSGSTMTTSGTGTLYTQVATTTSSTPIPSGRTWSFLVEYNGSAAQTVVAGTYNGLTLSGSTKSAGGTITMNGATTLTISSSIDMSTNRLVGSSMLTAGSGTFTTRVYTGISTTPIPTGRTWNFSVTYLSPNTQTVVSGTYSKLTLSGAAKTAGGAITMSAAGTLAINSGASIAMATNRLIATTLTTSGTGSLSTTVPTATSTTPIPSGITWTFAITYSSTSAQTVVSGTYNTLTLSGSAKTAAGAITMNSTTALTISSGASLAMGTNRLIGSTMTTSGTGSLTTTVPTSTSTTPLPSGRTWSFAVTYSSSSAQTVMGGTYNNTLTCSNSAKTAAGAITMGTGTTLSVASGSSLAMGTNRLIGTTLTTSGTGTISTTVPTATSAVPLPTGITWTQTVSYSSSSAQTIVAGTYANLSCASSTKSAAGAITVSGILTISSGSTLSMGTTATLSGATLTTSGTGTLNTAVPTATSSAPIPSGRTWTFGVSYTAATAQTVVGGTYATLSCSNSAKTATGDLAVSSTVTISSGSSLDLGSTYLLTGATLTTSGTGTLSTAVPTTTSSTPIPTGRTWTFSISYTSGSAQTLVQGTYASLNCSNSTKTVAGNLVINTGFTISSGAVVDMVTYTISGTFTASGTGTLRTQNTSSTPIPTGKTWTFEIAYNAAGAQTVVATSTIYNNLKLSGGAKTANANLQVDGIFDVASGCTLDLATYTLTGAFTTSGTGNLSTQNTGSTPLPDSKSWSFGISYNATTAQTIVGGATSYSNLAISGSATKTASGDFSSSGIFTLDAATTLDMSTYQLSGTFTPAGTGTLKTQNTGATPLPSGKAWGFSIEYNAANDQTIVAASSTYNNLTISGSGTKTSSADLVVNGNLAIGSGTVLEMASYQLSGSLTPSGTGTLRTQNESATPIPTGKAWTQTVVYNGSAAQSLVGGSTTYTNLTCSGSSTKTATGNVIVSGLLTISSGCMVDLSTNVLSGAFTTSGTGSLNTQNTSATPIPTGKTWNFGVVYSSVSSQTVVNGSYNDLDASGGSRTLSGTVNIAGNFTPGAASYTTTGSTVVFNGTGNQSIPVLNSAYNNLQLSTSGTKTLSGTINVNGTLNINNNVTLELGDYNVAGTGSSVLAAGATLSNATNTGVPGSITVSGTKTYSSSANYAFSGTTTETYTTTPVANTFNNLTIGGTSVALADSRTITGTLTLNGDLDISSRTLTINGSVTGAGKLRGNSSAVLVVGGNAGSIGFNASANTLKDLTLNTNATASISDEVNITAGSSFGTVTLAAGASLNTNNNLVLKSDANGTARVAELPVDLTGAPTASISGDVIIQKYVPGKRVYRFLAHPYVASQPLSILTDDIDITGTGGATNGFTTTQTNNPSAFWYDNTTSTWKAFTSTNGLGDNAWKQFQGIRVMVRGAKGQGLNTTTYTPQAVTFDEQGEINTGDVTVPLTISGTDGMNMIGNPYPSAVNINEPFSTATDIAGVWVWDPKIGTTGGYQTVTLGTDFNLPAYSAMFVEVSANTSVLFKESNKVANPTEELVRPMLNNRIDLQLSSDSITWDNLSIVHNSNASDAYQRLDVKKLANPESDLYTVSADNVKLSVDSRNIDGNTVIPISLKVISAGTYQLRTTQFNLPDYLTAVLEDTYTDTKTNLTDATVYSFSIREQDVNKQLNRFKVRFVSTRIIPIASIELNATSTATTANVNWKTTNESEIAAYYLQKSVDGKSFGNITTKMVEEGKIGTYQYHDAQTVTGINYYRIKAQMKDGSISYSNVAALNIAEMKSAISIYPNPIKGNSLQLQFANIEKGNYKLQIYDLNGKLLQNKRVKHAGGSNLMPVAINGIAQGVYQLVLVGEGTNLNCKLIKE